METFTGIIIFVLVVVLIISLISRDNHITKERKLVVDLSRERANRNQEGKNFNERIENQIYIIKEHQRSIEGLQKQKDILKGANEVLTDTNERLKEDNSILAEDNAQLIEDKKDLNRLLEKCTNLLHNLNTNVLSYITIIQIDAKGTKDNPNVRLLFDKDTQQYHLSPYSNIPNTSLHSVLKGVPELLRETKVITNQKDKEC